MQRLSIGEGLLLRSDPLFGVPAVEGQPLPPAPRVPRSRLVRGTYYRRIRSIPECERYLELVAPALVCEFELFRGFATAPSGLVSLPESGEQSLPLTHCVVLEAYDRERGLLRFRNSWGTRWGDQGREYMPYEYFEKYAFGSFASYMNVLPIQYKSETIRDMRRARWIAQDEWGRRVYGFDVLDAAGRDRLGWSFVVERDGALEVEELYVRPEHRGRKLGVALCDQLTSLFRAKGGTVRLWVPFADCRSESPGNYQALVSVVRRLGLVFQPCPERWAAYLATNSPEGGGAVEPIEPAWVPARPKSSWDAVLALSLALSPATEVSSGSAGPAHAIATAPEQGQPFPAVGSQAWGAMNRRRAELIRKKVRLGVESLSEEERREYEWLQESSRRSLEAAYPACQADRELIRSLKEQFGITSEPVSG